MKSKNKIKKMASKKTDLAQYTCGDCRLYVPCNTEIIPEWEIAKYNIGYCNPYKNGAKEMSVQRENKACRNFRKGRKPPKGGKVCACRECQYNNPTPDGHWCAFYKCYMAQKKCVSFKEKDYNHDDVMPKRFADKWNELNSL